VGRPLARELEARGAYRDLVAWAEPFGEDSDRAIRECPRGDWVLALAVALDRPRAAIVGAACDCAVLSVELAPDDDAAAAIAALDAARAWVERGLPIDPAIGTACAALFEHPDPIVQLAAAAAYAALASIDDPREAPAAAGIAVEIAAMHSAECGVAAAVGYARREAADRARRAFA
jgi:hypothetical protein